MVWEHPLLRRRPVQFRPISLIALIVTCSIMLLVVERWLRAPPAHIPSPAETKAIQAALVQYSTKDGHDPSASKTIKAINLEGTGWIVQVTERINPEAGELLLINTFHVDGGSSRRWLSTDEWGAY
jgi:hypothetical protein